MSLHPRYFNVNEAKYKVLEAILKIEQEYELTYGEIFGILGDTVSDYAKYAIRDERHPNDPGKKGDEA